MRLRSMRLRCAGTVGAFRQPHRAQDDAGQRCDRGHQAGSPGGTGNFDIILDHFARLFQVDTTNTLHTCDMPYYVIMLIER